MRRIALTVVLIWLGYSLAIPSFRPVVCAACSNPPPKNQNSGGWPKGTAVKIEVGNLPTSVDGKNGSGATEAVDLQSMASAAASELSTWVASNTNSGVTFTSQTSSCGSGDACVHINWGGLTQAPAGESITNNASFRATSQTVTIADTSALATIDYVAPSGRSGSIHYWDPMGNDYTSPSSNPRQDFIDAFKTTVKHELTHGLGLGDGGDCGSSIMAGMAVPNGIKSDGSTCQPHDPGECDKDQLKNVYPPTPEEDPNWWYAYCGITGDDVWSCEHQEDQYWYDYDNCSCTLGASPIIIDLDAGGFRLTSADDGVRFDLLGRGSPVQTAWTQAGRREAFLVLDRDGNGTIDSGLELFGNVTLQSTPGPGEVRNGFRALAEFDRPSQGGNGDGVITALDAVFGRLRLWIDSNHDGISQPSELFTLASQGVVAINLAARTSRRVDRYGNQMRYMSEVRLGDAAGVRIAIDVFFKWHY